MNRYRDYGPLDDVPDLAGDVQFKRLDMQSDPATLPPGVVQRSENFRFDVQGARVRAGVARQFAAGTDVGTIQMAEVYLPDRGNDQFAFVGRTSLFVFNPANQTVQSFAYPGGETVEETDAVDFLQGGIGSGTTPTAWIPRGFGKDALKFDGASVAVDSNFKKSEFGLFYQDRFVVNAGTQEADVSDFLDFATWSSLNQFQILKGGDDYLVSFIPYKEDYVIIGCRKKFFIAFFDPNTSTGGYSGGLKADTSFLRELTREAGLVGRRAIKEAAGLIWIISDPGIFAFLPQLDQKLTVLGLPISADIQPIMDRLSAKYASGATIERLGYRLYFAMPISEEKIKIADIVVTTKDTVGLELPFTLPTLLSNGGLATVETETPHNLSVGDRSALAGVADSNLNGEFPVLSIVDATHFTVSTNAQAGATVGTLATVQKLATRNNVIAVLNLNNRDVAHPNGSWESIDVLPSEFHADFLKVADYGSKRRLWVIDRELGPALYEEGDADEVGTVQGGVTLPFTLPITLAAANFATKPIPGRLTGRENSFGQFAREIRAGRARLALSDGDAGSITLRVQTPDATAWEKSREFAFDGKSDRYARKRCGKRGLNARVEIVTTTGRPTVRSLEIESTPVGKVQESS